MARQSYYLAGQFPLFTNLLQWSVWILRHAGRLEDDRAVAFRLVSLMIAYHALEAFLNEAAGLCLRSSGNLTEEERLCLSEKEKDTKGKVVKHYLSVDEKLKRWPPILGRDRGVTCDILADKEIHDSFEKLHTVRNKLVHHRPKKVGQAVLPPVSPDVRSIFYHGRLKGVRYLFGYLPTPSDHDPFVRI